MDLALPSANSVNDSIRSRPRCKWPTTLAFATPAHIAGVGLQAPNTSTEMPLPDAAITTLVAFIDVDPRSDKRCRGYYSGGRGSRLRDVGGSFELLLLPWAH